jgi:hypothetical protein
MRPSKGPLGKYGTYGKVVLLLSCTSRQNTANTRPRGYYYATKKIIATQEKVLAPESHKKFPRLQKRGNAYNSICGNSSIFQKTAETHQQGKTQ